MNVLFSSASNVSWKPIDFPSSGQNEWQFKEAKDANCAIKKQGLPPFQPIAFLKAELKSILNQSTCKHIAFLHLLAEKKHSTLLAYGLAEGDVILPPHMRVGTPVSLNFGSIKMGQATVNLNNTALGYEWKYYANANTTINDWLNKPLIDNRFELGLDFVIRCRIEKSEALDFLKQFDDKDIISIFPGVFRCEIASGTQTPDQSGDYCTLILHGPKKDTSNYSFFICSDAWRPNWPGSGSGDLTC